MDLYDCRTWGLCLSQMISGHLHKPVIILNLQEREPALEERLNCSSLHSHSQSQDFDPWTFGTAEPGAPSTAWLGWCVTLEEDTAIKNTFMGTLWTQSWWGGRPGEAEHAHETPRTQCSVPLWRRPGGHTGLLRPPSQPGGTSAAGWLDSDAGSATSCATLGMPLALSASVTQYSPHRLFRRSQEVTFALHTADAP